MTNVTLDESTYGHVFGSSKAWLCTEEGTGNVKVCPFPSVEEAKAAGKRLWVCWVVFSGERKAPEEKGYGGVGLATETIRRHARAWLKKRPERPNSSYIPKGRNMGYRQSCSESTRGS